MSVKFFSKAFPDTCKGRSIVNKVLQVKQTHWEAVTYLANNVEDAHDDLVQVAILHDVQMVDKHPFQASPDSPLHLSVQIEGGAEVVQPEVSQVVDLAEEENQAPSSTLACSFHG